MLQQLGAPIKQSLSNHAVGATIPPDRTGPTINGPRKEPGPVIDVNDPVATVWRPAAPPTAASSPCGSRRPIHTRAGAIRLRSPFFSAWIRL